MCVCVFGAIFLYLFLWCLYSQMSLNSTKALIDLFFSSSVNELKVNSFIVPELATGLFSNQIKNTGLNQCSLWCFLIYF